MIQKSFEELFKESKETSLKGRYITYSHILPLIEKLNEIYTIEEVGISENGIPIHLIKIGEGKKPLLFWSQMHGNESTTTKALFDFFNFLNSKSELATAIIKECTLYCIPMLNPDGAALYTRANYNKIDLNRDAQSLSQKESRVFRKIVEKVKPLVAFNLHGQRTIFSAGDTKNSAIVSFLSPSSDKKRTVTLSRKKGMRIIAEMNEELQKHIPNCVGRYDDGFNINCTGDTLENKGVTTILFEAGHHPNDYDREISRKWIFISLLKAVSFISSQDRLSADNYEAYFNIPENEKRFKDILIYKIKTSNGVKDIAIQFKEVLEEKKLKFIPYISEIEENTSFYGHLEFNAEGKNISIEAVNNNLIIDNKVTKIEVSGKEFSVFPIKN